MTDTLGMSPAEFEYLTLMSSWAVCGRRGKTEESSVGVVGDLDDATAHSGV